MSRWTDAELAIVAECRARGLSRADTVAVLRARGFDRDETAVGNAVNRRLAKWEERQKNISALAGAAALTTAMCEVYAKRINREAFGGENRESSDHRSETTKILALSDFHPPYQDEAHIMAAVTEHSDADVLVLNGDLFDFHALSIFSKKRIVTVAEEWDAITRLLSVFVRTFPKIVLTRGNHEDRLSAPITKELRDASHVWAIYRDRLDACQLLADGFAFDGAGEFRKLFDWGGKVHYDPDFEGGRAVMIGDCLFSHYPDYHSGGPLRTAHLVTEKIAKNKGLHPRAHVVAHTHHVGWAVVGGHSLLIEQGCCCGDLDYARGKTRYGASQRGYAVIYQTNGVTEFETSHVVYRG